MQTHTHSSLTPYSPPIINTLHTLIAPGQRVRLSPFIESAQYEVLFNKPLRSEQRYQDMRGILRDNAAKIHKLAQAFTAFSRGGKSFQPQTYTQEFLEVYLVYYLPVNVAKLQLVLLDLLRKGRLQGDLNVVDLGVGAGVTALAVADFLVAWANVCNLYQVSLPVSSVKLTGFDANSLCLKTARKMLQSYGGTLQQRLKAQDQNSNTPTFLPEIIHGIDQADWRQADINQVAIEPSAEFTLLVASNILNELSETGQNHLETYVGNLSPESIAVIIEPGDKIKSRALNTWRLQLVSRYPDQGIIAPCGSEQTGNISLQCDECWNARRESFHESLLYQTFRKACQDRRTFDDFTNNLLSWSYICLSKTATSAGKTGVADAPAGVYRYIGTFSRKEPVSYNPDADNGSDKQDWIEYIKLCPNGYPGKIGLTLERKAGIQIPALSFGDLVKIKGGTTSDLSPDVIKFVPTEVLKVEPVCSENSDPHSFLQTGSVQTRQAIDDIAYRLFGFPAMRPFQHTILERVLSGRHILGIAATGGGKSECFILPAMLLAGITVVVSPLKSLMQDQYEQRICDRYGLNHLATYINGDVRFKERQARLKRLSLGHYKLIYMTPEQLERQYVLDSLKAAHQRVGIRYLALDEAHCISQWGHDFRPSYLNLIRRLKDWGIDPVRIALTATASPEVRRDLCEELALSPTPLEQGGDVYVHSSNRHELNLVARPVSNLNEKSDEIIRDLKWFLKRNRREDISDAAIVFMPHTGGSPENTWTYLPKEENRSKSWRGKLSAGVTPFASFLERVLERPVAIYHSRMEQERHDSSSPNEEDEASQNEAPLGDLQGRCRRREQTMFIQGEKDIMVATKGFGMGIDKPNIRLVIHRTPPANLEAYAQEAGRAGRDGEISHAVLYYSPDAIEETDEKGAKSKIQSDYEIQEYFLSDKYIRREDVVVMRSFLRSVKRRVGLHLYFTNDEAISFFDRADYQWPEFPKREPKGKEFSNHTEILDRGHLYQEKTGYIDRILSALYRMRPHILQDSTRVAFLERVQETGGCVVGPILKNVDGIFGSNSYFGDVLRQKFKPGEFEWWLNQDNLLGLANRLGFSMTETAALLQDIKFADGHFNRHGHWVPDLLDFQTIKAPKYGPAANRNTLQAWRAYAGAHKRANGYSKAKKRGRTKPTLDDWFGWKELPNSKGWEVLPGPAFQLDQEFNAFLDAFMTLHDQREHNDWAAYRRLLTDYVGVSESGQLREQKNRNCLRAVMLGYLRTYEVISGDNCYSCSRCVPNGEFEQNLEKRKSVVVSLGSAIVEQLEEIETYSQTLPQQALINAFWQTILSEEQHGRSIKAYIEGWTGRLLADTPGHRAALWLRLKGMSDGLMKMQPREFTDNVRQLADHCTPAELEKLWSEILAKAHELLPDRLEVQVLRANVCHRLQRFRDEEQIWLQVSQHQSSVDYVHQANVALTTLYGVGGALENGELFMETTLVAARTAKDSATALEFYQPHISIWNWLEVENELLRIEENSQSSEMGLKLVDAWGRLAPSDEEFSALAELLTQTEKYLRWFQAAPVESMQLVSRLPEHVLIQFPKLADWWLENQAQMDQVGDEKHKFATLVLNRGLNGSHFSSELVERCGQILFQDLPKAETKQIQRQYAQDIEAIYQLFYRDYHPASEQAAKRWLEWFADLVARDIDQTAWSMKTLVYLASSAGDLEHRSLSAHLWQRVLETSPEDARPTRHKAAKALLHLSKTGHLVGRNDDGYFRLQAARTAPSAFAALKLYLPLLTTWEWSQIKKEIFEANDNLRFDAARVLVKYSLNNAEKIDADASDILQLLENTGIYQKWSFEKSTPFLQDLPLSFLQQFPKLYTWWLEWYVKSAKDKQSAQQTFEAILFAIANKYEVTDSVLKEGANIFFKVLAPDQVKALYHKYLGSLEWGPEIFHPILSAFQPLTNREFIRWIAYGRLSAFPIKNKESFEILETVIISESQKYGLNEDLLSIGDIETLVKQGLRSLIQWALTQPEHKVTAHKIWLVLCQFWPEEAPIQIEYCLSLSPPKVDIAEDYFESILSGDNCTVQLKQLQKLVGSDRSEMFQRAKLALECEKAMSQLVRDSDINTTQKIEPRHFTIIKRTFYPQESSSRAVMAATVADSLRNYLNPFWLTPISFQVEMLGLAGRPEAIKKIAVDYPQLMIGKKRMPVNQYLGTVTDNKEKLDNENDYQLIIKKFIETWKCLNYR